MTEDFNGYSESMLEMFMFETNQSIEQLEEILLNIESNSKITDDNINEIFRIMHTIKGSSSMMMFGNISKLTHSLEDLFYFIRENRLYDLDLTKLSDLVFSTIDFISLEISKIEKGNKPDGEEDSLTSQIKNYLLSLKENIQPEKIILSDNEKVHENFITKEDISEDASKYIAKVFFQEDCKMENMRAFTLLRDLEEWISDVNHIPEDLFDDDQAAEKIKKDGFNFSFVSEENQEKIFNLVKDGMFVDSVELEELEIDDYKVNKEEIHEDKLQKEPSKDVKNNIKNPFSLSKSKNIISVNVEKMDMLMDLVGEIVITESMVTKNPELKDLELENFNKAARQLRKLNNELQDIVMSIRMIQIGPTFHKMHRIVRDMNKQLGKNTRLEISGEETEVDKNIIDTLGEPLMHLIRNSLDHGIESKEERLEKGKDERGLISLDAVNTGGDVIISIQDDGKGLDRDKIIQKASKNNLITKSPEDMSDREVFSLILLPGFSTKEDVTEYSGRGVGMDVVKRSIEKVGGNIQIESEKDKGTTISIKIPLTLAIIDGMKISVGESIFTVPTTTIKESFKAKKEDLMKDTSDNEMILIRGDVYPVVRLHEVFNLKSEKEDLLEGILVMVETDESSYCLFADEILGEQQVVVKPIPGYLRQYKVKDSGVAGCAILGNADISLILDISGIANEYI
jgi:two-component system chemotaxis sensor kinase CheA